MSNTTKVTIEGKDYFIDLDKAKKLGLIQEQGITKLNGGDLFTDEKNSIYCPCLIVENSTSIAQWKFQLVFENNRTCPADLINAPQEKIMEWLNKAGYTLKKNIRKKYDALFS